MADAGAKPEKLYRQKKKAQKPRFDVTRENPSKGATVKKSYCALEEGNKVARSCQGRVWWNACVEEIEGTGPMRVEVLFPKGQDSMPAVGMLPPTLSRMNMEDWMGRQPQSTSVWFDGQVLANGTRHPDISPSVFEMGENGVLLELEWEAGRFSILRNDELIYEFNGVPRDWRFCVGGFGGKCRLIDEGEDSGDGGSKVAISKIVARNLPDGDMGKGSGSSEAYVQFQLMNQAGRRVKSVRTSVVHNPAAECEWEDTVVLALPPGFSSGQMAVTVWDDDLHSADDALGGGVCNLSVAEGVVTVDALAINGLENGAGGTFPDFELGFALEYRGAGGA